MPSVTKTRSISIQNYEKNVFNESEELVDFYGTDSLEKEDFEDLDSNKRIKVAVLVTPDVNKAVRSKTLNSIKNNHFSDSDTKTVNENENFEPKTSYGVYSKSKENKSFDSRFDGIEDVNNISLKLIRNELEELYPYVIDLNANEILNKGSYLDPLNLYKEITRDILTEFNEKGVKAIISNSGAQDCRRRVIHVSNFYSKNNKSIEPFDDHGEPDDIMTVFDRQEYYENNFIRVSLVNGREVYSINQSNIRFKPITSKETRYLSNENCVIEPFVEKEFQTESDDSFLKKSENRFYLSSDDLNSFFLNKSKTIMKKVYNDNVKSDVKYSSFGFSNDYSKTHGIESIAFRGLVK